MGKFKVAVVAVLSVVLGISRAWAQAPGPSGTRFNIPYGPDPAQQLDLCLPTANQPGQRPAVVMIHGGYWSFGDKSAYAQLCRIAAAQGIVAATINYRLADGRKDHRWPAQLVDAQLAVRWLRSRALEFGLDPQRICALGDSAGAHLAVFLGVRDSTILGDYARELPGVSSSVSCVVDNFGPVDLTSESLWPPDQNLFGSDGHQRPTDQEHAASPIFLVGRRTAPIMIAHGRQDKAVSIDQSLQLLDRLRQYGVPAKMVQMNGGHEFDGLPASAIQAIFQAELDFIKRPQ